MTQVVSLHGGGGAAPPAADFAAELHAAANRAVAAGATAAVLIFFDGTRQLDPVAVNAPWPMQRGMMEEAQDFYSSRTAGYAEERK